MGPGWEPWGRAISPQQRRLIAGGVHGFRPYSPPPVPTGSYDPTLDAQLGQSQRGLGDLRQDTETANTRDTVDYQAQQGDINRQIDQLHTGYEQLGGRQQEQANAAGLLRGGAMLQAAQKRAANEARDKVPMTEALQRLALESAPPSADNPLGGRRFQDRTTALTRAEREGSQFGIDVNSQKLYQASQVGYVAPGRGDPGGMPRNEHVSATGMHTRDVRIGGTVYTYDEHGNIIGRRRVPGPGRARQTGPNTAAGVGRI